jgi:manganese efflux pump family protein
MNIFEILLISIGLSFDVFAVTIVEGAMLAKVEKKKLAIMCAIFCLWQFVAVMAGNLLTLIPVFQKTFFGIRVLWTFVSTVIFFALAAFMFYKAWRKEDIFEQSKEISYKHVCITALIVSLDAFFAGIGFGFLDAELLMVGLVLELVTVLFVILGIMTGYRLGCEQRPKVLYLGATCILLASIEVTVRFFAT